MKKTKDPELFISIANFQKVYAPIIRRRSPNTIKSYGSALNLFFCFLKETQNKTMFQVSATDFNSNNILMFLDWLQNSRNCKVSSINQRLAHLKTFCNYMMKNKLVSISELDNIKEISPLDDVRKTEFIYLSIDDIKSILKLPDTTHLSGIRDKLFIALLYDSGCRDQELLDLQIKDFCITNPNQAELHVVGKGNKPRTTPISLDVVKIFLKYCNDFEIDINDNPDQYIFSTRNTRRGGEVGKMSADNTQRILRKYEELYKKQKPDCPHLHAHLFRRTRAMHLYMAGVDLSLIADWLGHANLETVQVYARATAQMKRSAAAKVGEGEDSVFKGDYTSRYINDEESLKKLCGLK